MKRRIQIAALEQAVQWLHWLASLMSDSPAKEFRRVGDVLSDLSKELQDEQRKEQAP